ncbi:hypothetical protein OC844_004366 [Tilletia horrida]|nr:hypothetical protein OC844_004366 [Tilletia horrida]
MHSHLSHQLPPLHPQSSLCDSFTSAAAARKAYEASAFGTSLDSPTFSSDDYAAEVLIDSNDSSLASKPHSRLSSASAGSSATAAALAAGHSPAGSHGIMTDELPADEQLSSAISHRPFSYVSQPRASIDRRSHYDHEADREEVDEDVLDMNADDDDEDDFFDDDLVSRNYRSPTGATPGSASTAAAALRRRSFVPPTPTVNATLATPGLAGDDLPGAKARKVLGLDSEGWEIGPGSSDPADGSHSQGRSSTSRRATARVTALLSGGGSSSSSTSGSNHAPALSHAAVDGLPSIQHTPVVSASSTSSRRHSLLPSMLSLGSKRPSVSQAQTQTIQEKGYSNGAPIQQAHTYDVHLSSSHVGQFSGGAATSSSLGSTGPNHSTMSYFATPSGAAPGLHASSSLPIGLTVSSTPMRGSADVGAASGGGSNSVTSSAASSAVKGLRKVRGRKQNASATTSTYTIDDSSLKGVGSVSLADAQDWERALETAERNASWYSSIAHRPRARPPPSTQPTKGTPVPRAGSTSSASSTPTTDQSHHSLFYGGQGTGAGMVHRGSGTNASFGPEGHSGSMHAVPVGLGLSSSVRRSVSASDLTNASAMPMSTSAPHFASGPHSGQAFEQEEELLDEGSASGVEGSLVGGGLPPSAYPHLQTHAALGSPIRSHSAAGFSHNGKADIGMRSPGFSPVQSAAGMHRYSAISNVLGSPERFGLAYGSHVSGSRGNRFSPNSIVSASPGRPRRPSNDPHPLPASIIDGLPLDRDRDRRPSLSNEILTSAPGWSLASPTGAGTERFRSGSFGSAVTPGSVFASGLAKSAAGGAISARNSFVGGSAHPHATLRATGLSTSTSSAAASAVAASPAAALEPNSSVSVIPVAMPATTTPAALASPTVARVMAPAPMRQSPLEGVIVFQLDERVQERLVGATDRRPRESIEAEAEAEAEVEARVRGLVDGGEDGGGVSAANEAQPDGENAVTSPFGHRRRGLNSSISSQDSGRDSVLVNDVDVDGALGRAFRLYSAQLESGALEEAVSPRAEGGPFGRRNREESETTQVGDYTKTAANSPRTPQGAQQTAAHSLKAQLVMSTPPDQELSPSSATTPDASNATARQHDKVLQRGADGARPIWTPTLLQIPPAGDERRSVGSGQTLCYGEEGGSMAPESELDPSSARFGWRGRGGAAEELSPRSTAMPVPSLRSQPSSRSDRPAAALNSDRDHVDADADADADQDGDQEGDGDEQQLYREMYSRDLPMDLPRPVSVCSGSQAGSLAGDDLHELDLRASVELEGSGAETAALG